MCNLFPHTSNFPGILYAFPHLPSSAQHVGEHMQHCWQRNFDRLDNLIHQGLGTEAFFRSIEQELPPVVSREVLSKATGGLISAKTLSNEDALRKGPTERVRAGSKIGYTRFSAMAYIRKKIQLL